MNSLQAHPDYCYQHQQCPAPDRYTRTPPPAKIGRHIGNVRGSQALPHWKHQGQQLHQLAQDLTLPTDAWSARAVIAPLKHTLSEFLLAVSSLRLKPVSDVFSRRTLAAISQHLSELGKQLAPWSYAGVQAQTVPGAAKPEEFVLVRHSEHGRNKGAEQHALHQFNRTLRKILTQNDYLPAAQNATLDDRQILGEVMRFLHDVPGRAVPLLARNIQKLAGQYGGHRDEWMAFPRQEEIIQHWLERGLLNTDLGHFLAQKLVDRDSSKVTVADLPRLLESSTDLGSASKNQLVWRHLVQTALPILHATTREGDTDVRWEDSQRLRLDDFDWGKIHAGLLFANSVKLAVDDMSMSEAMDLGAMLLVQLQEGTVPTEWWRYFALPAELRYALTQHTVADMATDAIALYAADYHQLQEDTCPFLQLKTRLDDFETRPQLAQKLIDRDCPHLSVDDYLDYAGYSQWIVCEPDQQPIRLYDVTQLYQHQIDQISQAYHKVDPLLLAVAWGELTQEELQFLLRAEITVGKAHFAANDVLPLAGWFYYLAHQKKLTMPLRPGVELLAANIAGSSAKERIYSLERGQNGYQLTRIDHDTQAYLALTDAKQRQQFQAERFTLHIDTEKKDVLKYAHENLTPFFSKLAEKHRILFAQQLYDFGYGKTGKEKAVDFGLSMLPFYTCIKSSNEGSVGEAVFACSIDAIALLPVLGGLSLLSIKFGQALARGSLIAGRHMLSDWAARGSIKAVLGHSSQHFLRYAIWPASQHIGKKEMQAVAVTVLRGLDPGVELMCHVGHGSVSQALRLGCHLKHSLPSLQKTLPKLENALKKIPPELGAETYTYAHLSGNSVALPVVRLDGERYQNVYDVYVRINPDSGAAFGKKYTLSAGDTLTPVPVPVARRLINIRQQGLGGLGGPSQAQIWSRTSRQQLPLSYIVLYRLSRLKSIEFEISGGLRGIAEAMNTQPELLQLYFEPNGALTPLAQSRLDQGEAGPSHHSNDFFYRLPTEQDIEDWNRMRQVSSITVTKNLFTTVRNIKPSTWNKIVRVNTDLTANSLSTPRTPRLRSKISFEDIDLWMSMSAQERHQNSRVFALARGIAPNSIARYVTRGGELTKNGRKRFGPEIALSNAARESVKNSAAQDSAHAIAGHANDDAQRMDNLVLSPLQLAERSIAHIGVGMRFPTAEDLNDWKNMPYYVRRLTSRESFSRARNIFPGSMHRMIQHDGVLTTKGTEFMQTNADWNRPLPDSVATPQIVASQAESATFTSFLIEDILKNTDNSAAQVISGQLLADLHSLGATGIDAAGGLANFARQHQVSLEKLHLYINENGQLTPKGRQRVAIDNIDLTSLP